VSGGFGFANDSTAAIGGNAIVRIDGSWSAIGGAAVSTEGRNWGAHVGARAGW
jgi:hypothetical protein